MPLRSSSLAATVLLGAAAAMAACSTAAPSLPPERSVARTLDTFPARDARMTCDQIAQEWQATTRERHMANQNIAANRQNNQTAAYIGAVIFPPAYIATEGNYADKDRLAALQSRRDTLIDLGRTKSCPPLT